MTLEQRSEKAKGERHTAQTASERQATSQWKSTGERGAESRGEKRGTEVQRYGCYRYSTLLPYSFPAEFIQLEDGFLQYQLNGTDNPEHVGDSALVVDGETRHYKMELIWTYLKSIGKCIARTLPGWTVV